METGTMSKMRWSAALALIAAAGIAWAQGAPVNKTCPVKTGTPVAAGNTTTYKGKTIGFC